MNIKKEEYYKLVSLSVKNNDLQEQLDTEKQRVRDLIKENGELHKKVIDLKHSKRMIKEEYNNSQKAVMSLNMKWAAQKDAIESILNNYNF